MSAIELTARSVEDAKKTAADKLGVDASRVTVKVLEETKGLFGKVNYRVLAEVIAEPEAAPAAAPAEKAEAKPKAGRGRTAKAEPAEAEAEPVVEAEPEAPVAPARGRRKTEKAAEPKVAEVSETVEASEATESEEVEATETDGADYLALVNGLLANSGLTIEAQISSLQGRYVNLSLDGKDSSYLVGKHGEVLNSLQYLVNIIGGRKFQRGVRATVECNDWRRRREEKLTKQAAEIAAQVLERGEEAVLDALPAFERRIVHKALQDIPGITTYSEGEEPNRRVVIGPAE
ncbi:Jag Predicted RNA-binding protein [Fimbriimonadaceae bacterium]